MIMGAKHVNLAKERIGITSKNKFGTEMELFEYINANDIWVKFENGETTHTTWDCFVRGEVKNVFDKSVFGVGYIGEGIYKPNVDKIKTNEYQIWISMLSRCYDEEFKEKFPTYKNTKVVTKWHNFQNFAKWYSENYYEIEGERMNLDKDILFKGNKIYSPKTCVFVPQRINILFVKNDSIRGELPIGVYFEKQTNKYRANCKIGNGKAKNLGRYNTPEEAFQVYKIFKEKYIKQVAEEYKSKIPEILYNALLNYVVEIID
jgi:hypothetical protein